MINKKRFLFYLVHPAKYHFHKIQINELLKKGHEVDILINTKDMLEELVIHEGWTYKNIFPNGRKIKGLHVYLSAFISIFRAVYKLLKFTKGKKYDLFIGDLTTILGIIKRVPSLYPTDDVLSAVPEQAIFFSTTSHIIAPQITDVGKYKNKKIPYYGYKSLAHLHPNHFKPNETVLSKSLIKKRFFLVRCTGFNATHDLNKKGISDDLLYKIIDLLRPHGEVLISSERELPPEILKHELNINKGDINHYMYYADLFISDSTTMSSEAAVLGTPSIEFDEYFHEIDQMKELEDKYQLIHCFNTSEEESFLNKISSLVLDKDLSKKYEDRRDVFLKDVIDLSAFLTWFYENYPKSFTQFLNNPDIQKKFQ